MQGGRSTLEFYHDTIASTPGVTVNLTMPMKGLLLLPMRPYARPDC
jgi:hypothetical protein